MRGITATTEIIYHGVSQKPKIYFSLTKGRAYIKVRDGRRGFKRLFLDTPKAETEVKTGLSELLKEAKRIRLLFNTKKVN